MSKKNKNVSRDEINGVGSKEPVVEQSESVLEETPTKVEDKGFVEKLKDVVKPAVKKVEKTVKNKVAELTESNDPAIKNLMNSLKSYGDEVGPGAVNKGPKFVASKNYALYMTLKSVVETKDIKEFTAKMDAVSIVFKDQTKGAFDEFRLHRYDQQWTWGKKSLTTYQNLVTVICTLCDASKRKDAIKLVDLDKAFDVSQVSLSEDGISNIKRYYA